MGGFQKFPIPRYVMSDSWMYNKQWFRNTVHITIPAFILSFVIYRGAVISQSQLKDNNVYIDPEDYQSPKKLVF